MIRRIAGAGAALALAAGALALAGCGSGSSRSSSSHATASSAAAAASPHTTTLPSGQTLVEAADRAAAAPGYRVSAIAQITDGSAHVAMRMKGVVQDHGTVAAFTADEAIAGRQLTLQIRTAHGKYYMSGIPGLSLISHGRRWLSFDLAQAQSAEGIGGLQSAASANPAQFLSYLRAVGSDITRVGSTTIGGDETTEYRATVDLDRYTRLVAPAKRAVARQTITRLESQIGSHTLPITVWVDGRHQIRRMHLQFPVCTDGQHLSLAMTMDMSDYGTVAPVSIPAASQTDDVTSKLKAELKSHPAQTAGCAKTSSS